MSIPRLKHYQRTSADMKNLTSKVIHNAAYLLASRGCDFTASSIAAIVDSLDEEQLVYGIHLDSTHGAQARQSRFYGIRKLFAAEPSQIPAFSCGSVPLLPATVNNILSYVYMRAEPRADDCGRSTLKVFFGKASRPNAGKVEEFFSLAKTPATRGMELLGTGAKTEIAPAGSGGTPIAIAEPLFASSPKTMSDEEIAAVLAASGNAAITDRLDTDFRSVFTSDKE